MTRREEIATRLMAQAFAECVAAQRAGTRTAGSLRRMAFESVMAADQLEQVLEVCKAGGVAGDILGHLREAAMEELRDAADVLSAGERALFDRLTARITQRAHEAAKARFAAEKKREVG